MSDPAVLANLVATVERDVGASLERVVDELGIDDGPTLAGLGALLSEVWMAGASAAGESEAIRAAIDAGATINEDAVRAMAESVRPKITVDDVLAGIAGEAARRGDLGRGATRKEIAVHLQVSEDEISREGRDPDGPLGRAVSRGFVAAHPSYLGYWLLTPAGVARLSG
jgi:hypothetical protein